MERLPKQTRLPKQLWLWWHGPQLPDLPRIWRAYIGRFKLEHTYRFVKQFLNWTLPRVRHPELPLNSWSRETFEVDYFRERENKHEESAKDLYH